jgi:hypothetical protein
LGDWNLAEALNRQIDRSTTAMKIGIIPTRVVSNTGAAWVRVLRIKEYFAEKSRY